MNEVRVTVNQKRGEIAFNADEIRDALRVQMEAYAELEVTEENIPERKADVATLRKIKAAIDDKRKEVKKTYDEPLKAFEAEVKSITGVIDEQIVRINAGLEEFEQKRIEEKRKHVKEIYDSEIGGLAEFLPFGVIYSAKWDNKTCGDNEIISYMQEMKIRVKNDLEAIKALHSEFEEKLIAAYKASGNTLSVAIAKHNDFEEAKRATEEKARKEAERAQEVAREGENALEQVNVQPQEKKARENTLVVRVVGDENIRQLKELLAFNEIPYEEVWS